VGGGVVEDQKPLMRFSNSCGSGSRPIGIIQAPLNIKVRLHQVHIALALRTHNGVVVNAQPGTDAFKGAAMKAHRYRKSGGRGRHSAVPPHRAL